MLSKNNQGEIIYKMAEQKQRFSLRKYGVGVASVLIGLAFLGGGSMTVHAADVTGPQTAVPSTASTQVPVRKDLSSDHPGSTTFAPASQVKEPTSGVPADETSQTATPLTAATAPRETLQAPANSQEEHQAVTYEFVDDDDRDTVLSDYTGSYDLGNLASLADLQETVQGSLEQIEEHGYAVYDNPVDNLTALPTASITYQIHLQHRNVLLRSSQVIVATPTLVKVDPGYLDKLNTMLPSGEAYYNDIFTNWSNYFGDDATAPDEDIAAAKAYLQHCHYVSGTTYTAQPNTDTSYTNYDVQMYSPWIEPDNIDSAGNTYLLSGYDGFNAYSKIYGGDVFKGHYEATGKVDLVDLMQAINDGDTVKLQKLAAGIHMVFVPDAGSTSSLSAVGVPAGYQLKLTVPNPVLNSDSGQFKVISSAADSIQAPQPAAQYLAKHLLYYTNDDNDRVMKFGFVNDQGQFEINSDVLANRLANFYIGYNADGIDNSLTYAYFAFGPQIAFAGIRDDPDHFYSQTGGLMPTPVLNYMQAHRNEYENAPGVGDADEKYSVTFFELDPQAQTSEIDYVDRQTDKTVQTTQLTGQTGEKVALNIMAPAGYTLADGQIIPAS